LRRFLRCLLIALAFAAMLPSAAALAGDPAPAAVTPSGGPKKSIAVSGFTAAELALGGATPDQLSALLINALIRDGRFVVVERAALGQIQAEQALGTAGATVAGTAPVAGRMLGASVLVQGTVTKFDSGAGGSSLNIGGFGLSNQTAMCEISQRIIDATTGQIIQITTAKGSASAHNFQVQGSSGGLHWDGGAFMKTPLGQALQDAIDKGVEQIAAVMLSVPWSSLVIESDGTQVFITGGADQNIQPGMVMHVTRPGKVLTDPATGAVLDTTMEDVATLQIQSVRAKVSVATITAGSAPARGDVVHLN
jgi:curli biogenesis system outer membrane secretion channel CsgG